MSNKKIAIHGSYYAGNFGDTLLIKIMCNKVASIVGESNVFLAQEGNKKEQREIGYPVVENNMAKDITHIIFAGGGYFSEPQVSFKRKITWAKKNYDRHLKWLKDFRNAKKAIFSAEFGPISCPYYKHMARKLVRESDVVYLRNQESVRDSKSSAAKECVDMALSVEVRQINKIKESIGLHLQNISDEEKIKIISYFVSSSAAKILLLTDRGNSDEHYGSKKMNKFIEKINLERRTTISVLDYLNPENLIEEIAKLEQLVTTKLHVGIVGTALGLNVISIPTHKKTKRFYRQLGVEEFCIDYKDFTIEKFHLTYKKIDNYNPDKDLVKKSLKELETGIETFLGL